MKKRIVQMHFMPQKPRLQRVAAYCRVSSDKSEMLHSLSAQVSYYSDLIQSHEGWEYAGVYSDEGITGTKMDRPGFQAMIEDCKHGKIDIVITKSISRFARNTVTMLSVMRELKALGISVIFEKEGINTLTSDGELMMTILASYAQEESLSASENQKWRIKKNFEEGMPWNGTLLGYKYDHGKYVIVPEEAEIVRWIFDAYLGGMGTTIITKHLNERGIPTRKGNIWTTNTVTKLLRNYAYTGNLLLQQTYRENHLTKRILVNRGELPMYHAENVHEAIIDMDTFQRAQEELERRREQYSRRHGSTCEISSLIKCSICGKSFRRKTTHGHTFWLCSTYNTRGKAVCPGCGWIPEDRLQEIIAGYGIENISSITAMPKNQIELHLKDGSNSLCKWEQHSRAESWTPEMKQAARERNLRKENRK